MRALKSELKEQAIKDPEGKRLVNLVDSRVVLGAHAKGRSSSLLLNGIQRTFIPYSICGRKHVTNLWVDTHNNPSDHPSRGKAIPGPSPAPQWLKDKYKDLLPSAIPKGLSHLSERQSEGTREYSTDCFVCKKDVSTVDKNTCFGSKNNKPCDSSETSQDRIFREIFSGCGKLTRTFRASKNWNVKRPLEAFPRGKYDTSQDILTDTVFSQLCIDACCISEGRQHWHFGLPCSSFSIINLNMNGGTRNSDTPNGNGSLERERVGNTLLERTLKLIKLLSQSGHTWTLENPGTSFVFRMPKVVRLLKRQSVSSVKFDQCMFGLKIEGSQDGMLTKKFTRIIGNINLDSLFRKCDHGHQHQEALGSTKTATGWKNSARLAGAYPVELCRAIQKVALEAHP